MNTGVVIIAIINMCLGAFFIAFSIPFLRGKIHKNAWYGFRVGAKTEEEWQRINVFGAQRFIVWSKWLIGIALLSLAVYGISFAMTIPTAVFIVIFIFDIFCGAIFPLIAVFQTAFYASDISSSSR